MAFINHFTLTLISLALGTAALSACSGDTSTTPNQSVAAGGSGASSQGGGGGAQTGGAGGVSLGGSGGGGAAGGGGGTTTSSGVEVLFPPLNALTDEDMITVRGTAAPGTQSITVAGVTAVGSGGLDAWKAEVPLSAGEQTLTIDMVDGDGKTIAAAASINIERNALPGRPQWLDLDGKNNRAFVADPTAVFEVDLTTKARRIVSSSYQDPRGDGPSFGFWIEGLAWDEAGGRLLVIDRSQLLSVDIVSGDRTLLASSSKGTGNWQNPSGDIRLHGGSVIFPASSWLMSIDLATGNRTEVSGLNVGSGQNLSSARGIAIDAANDRAYVPTTQRLLAVDLTTGDRTVVFGPSVGSGASPARSAAIDLDLAGNRLFASTWNSLVAFDLDTSVGSLVPQDGTGPKRVTPRGLRYDGSHPLFIDELFQGILSADPSNGNSAIVSAGTVGPGDDHLLLPSLVTWDPVGQRFLVGLGSTGPAYVYGTLIAVDPATSARTVIASNTIGTGPFLQAYDVEPFGGIGLVAGIGPGSKPAILSLDFATGNRTLISTDGDGMGTDFGVFPLDVTQNATGSQLWALVSRTDSTAAVFAVDPSDGTRTIISDASNGTGPALTRVCDILFANGKLIVVDAAGIIEVDPMTGRRVLLSGDTKGTGTPLSACDGVGDGEAYLHPDGTLYTHQNRRVVAVDLNTGNRTDISGNLQGKGPLINPVGFDGDDQGRLVITDQSLGLLAIDAVTGERVIFSK